MIAAARVWFAALTQREQWLVGSAGGLTAFVVLVFGLIMPVLSAVEQAKLDQDAAVQRRGRIVATVDAALAKPRVAPATAPANIDLLITQSAGEKGFDIIKSGNAPPGQISFRIEQARAPALLAWLTELEAQNISVSGLTLRTGTNGSVTVDAQLQQDAP